MSGGYLTSDFDEILQFGAVCESHVALFTLENLRRGLRTQIVIRVATEIFD